MLLRQVSFTADLYEARKPNLNYSFKEVKGKLDKITLKLEGNQSGVFTKIGKRYKEIDDAVKKLELERNNLNENIKDQFAEYFDESTDTVVTRIIETVSLTMQLSKRTAPEMGKDKVDYEKALLILGDMLPELKEKIDEVKKLCTTAGTMSVPKSPALSVKINEGLVDKFAQKVFELTRKAIRLAQKFKMWANNYDTKINKLKHLIS